MSVASTDRAPVNIDADVEILTQQVETLRELGQKESSEGEVYDFSIRWGVALAGRLPRLVHYSSQGLLNAADQRRFQSLCDELRAVSDIANRLGLVRPVLPGDREATANGHRQLKMRSRFLKRRQRS
jgi:hypothetical protein